MSINFVGPPIPYHLLIESVAIGAPSTSTDTIRSPIVTFPTSYQTAVQCRIQRQPSSNNVEFGARRARKPTVIFVPPDTVVEEGYRITNGSEVWQVDRIKPMDANVTLKKIECYEVEGLE